MLVSTLRGLRNEMMPNLVAVMENVGGYFPGNSGPASVKFARHCGHIEAACSALYIPVRKVAPQTWQKFFAPVPKEKRDRKQYIADCVRAFYPDLKVTLKTADALGILHWAIMQEKQ